MCVSVCVSLQAMWEFTHLVTLESDGTAVNKIVTVPRKAALLAKAEETFGLKSGSCAIEYFSKTYDVFIRPEAVEEIPHEGKVRLVLLPSVLDASSISSTSTVPILTIQATDGDLAQPLFLTPSLGGTPS